MDTNYILGREQTSLHNAAIAASSPARIAHEELAAAYGAILAERGFPHRYRPDVVSAARNDSGVSEWDNEGGATRITLPNETSAIEPREAPQPPELVHGARGRVVITPEGPQPYKVVIEHEQGRNTEQPVGSVWEGEQLIVEQAPRPSMRDTLFDWPPAQS